MIPQGPPVPVADPMPEQPAALDEDNAPLVLIWLGPVAIMFAGFVFGTFVGAADNALPLDWDYVELTAFVAVACGLIGGVAGLPGFLFLLTGRRQRRSGLTVAGVVWMVIIYLAALAAAVVMHVIAIIIRTPIQGDYA